MAGAGIQTGPAIRVVVHSSPGQSARIADDIAVNQVADASKGLTNSREERAGIEHDKRIHAFAQGAPEEDRNNQEDCTKEGHAALPGRQDTPGLLQIARHQVWLLHNEIEASTDQAGHDTPPEDPIDLVRGDAFARRISPDSPESHDNRHDIHQAIPGHFQRADAQDSRIDVDVNIRTNTQPAPIDQAGQRRGKISHDAISTLLLRCLSLHDSMIIPSTEAPICDTNGAGAKELTGSDSIGPIPLFSGEKDANI